MSGYPRWWTQVTPLTLLLAPVSWLYRMVVALRRALYAAGVLRVERLPVPVIVVGNISAGGTGKTPLVLWLAERLREAGYVPGIVSRGYGAGAKINQPRAVDAQDDPALCGDEPVLLARRSGCPVWISADRVAAARALLAANPACSVILSDDGLQHYRLARDAEVAVIDGTRGHGNGWMLPVGPLREPPSRLNSVDAVVIRGNGAPPVDSIAAPRFTLALAPGAFYQLLHPRITAAAGHFRGLRVHAAAGIGNPDHFFTTLKGLGIDFTAHPFPDHHRYTPDDLAFEDFDTLDALEARAVIVMTEKDAVKCARFATENMWALGVTAQVDTRLATLLIERLQTTRRKP